MTPLPVAWTEGMFLRPQHFQAADRHWAAELADAIHWHHPFSYGISAISFSEDAIRNSQFELTSCDVRFRDGTAVRIGQGLDRLDLKAAFQERATVRVCLAAPRMANGVANLGLPGTADLARFHEVSVEEPDENAGGNEQSVSYRHLNVRLCLDSDNLSGFEILPIAQIRRLGDREGTPELDARYAPPLLSADGWPELQRDLVRGVHDLLGRKIDLVSQQVRSRGITLAAREPGDLERLFMLQVLNSAEASLGALAYAPRMHPFPLYAELCRIVGQLSVFSPQRRSTDIPRYDHDDVLPIFRELRQRIESLIQVLGEYEFEQRAFVGFGRGLRVSLEPKWLEREWEWFVGVSSNQSHDLVRQLITRLDWKIGSADRVEHLFQLRARGLEQIADVKQVPRALPPDSQWLFYEVNRSGPEWLRAAETRSLGIRLQEQMIINIRELEGQEEVVVKTDAGPITLTFSLFAVPVRSGLSGSAAGAAPVPAAPGSTPPPPPPRPAYPPPPMKR
ncbi:MAG: type VI secretion system baseplate subunit TssK [Planctomyces sp.]|nr:type VI secretion system baseplate subunit TssK [Planctomyces sp.]